jgi:hypothetical protein
MVKALMVTDLEKARQVAMNPAGVVWPEWPDEDRRMHTARTRKWRDDKPVTILNKDWRPTMETTDAPEY